MIRPSQCVFPNITNGYYILDGLGAVHWCLEDANFQIATAPWSGDHPGIPRISQPFFGWDIARDFKILPNGIGYILLDGYGNFHILGNPRFTFPTDTGQLDLNFGGGTLDIGVQFTALADYATGEIEGLYVLDKFGVIYTIGNAPEIEGPVYGTPKAKALAISPFYHFITGAGVVTGPQDDTTIFDIFSGNLSF